MPLPNRESPEVTRQYPVHGTGHPDVPQDPFDTQMEVPFSEDTVEPVFKKPEIMDFEIPPVLEEMIPDGSLIHKHLPKQADIDKIVTQINRKYLRRMHLPCSLKDMQAAYMQSPHFCDIYVTQLRSGEDPELRNTLKNASYRGGRAAKCFKYSPTEGDGEVEAIRSSPG